MLAIHFKSLYFIAIVPPIEIQKEITGFKHHIAEQFGSKHALNAPPHITLHMPFKWKDKKIEHLKQIMNQLNNELTTFDIALSDFDCFEPRVIFIDVVENEQLNQLQKKVVNACRRELKLDNANYRNKAFHPHITIAFRDLRKKMFYEAKEEFENREFSANFLVEKVKLLRLDGSRWNIFEF